MATLKPDVSKIWASNALPTDITNPDTVIAGKQEQGWLGDDIPPHSYFNHEQNKVAAFANHVNIEGLPIWDAASEYVLNSYAKDPTTGRQYRSLVGSAGSPNVGNAPASSPAEWREQIETELEDVVTPINTLPVSLDTIATQKPLLSDGRYKSLYGIPHQDSEFRIATDETMLSVIYLSGSIGPVTEHQVTSNLAVDDDYWFDIRYQDDEGVWSSRSTPTVFTLPAEIVQTPTNTAPDDGDDTITDTVTLNADAFNAVPAGTHSGSQWQISTDNTFSSVDFDSGDDPVNLVSFTQAGLSLFVQYFWRVRYKDSVQGFSAYSAFTSFTTIAATIEQPTNLTPTDTSSDIGATAMLTATAFSVVGAAQTHDASQWQVSTNPEFTQLVFDSGADINDLESIVATGLEDSITTHYWRVRYKGSTTGFSSWSATFTFSTQSQFARWDLWDGTNDGVDLEYSPSTLIDDTVKAGVTMCPLGNDRFMAWYATSAGNILYQVLGVNGLIVGEGGEKDSGIGASRATGTQGSIVNIGANKVLACYLLNTNAFSFHAADISGTTATFGAGVTQAVNGSRYSISRIEDDKALFVYSPNTTSTIARVLSISGTTITMGAPVTISGSPDAVPAEAGTIEVRNKRAIIPYDGELMRMTAIDIDTDTNVITVLEQNIDNNNPSGVAGTRFYSKWLNDTEFFIGEVVSGTQLDTHSLFLCSFETGGSIDVLTTVTVGTGTATTDLSSGMMFADTGVNEVMITYPIDGDKLYGRIVSVRDGVVFTGTEIILTPDVNNWGFGDLRKVDSQRLIATWTDGTKPFARILNGGV